MKNKYLIFSQARSGSTTLAACLTIAKRLNGGKPITSMIQEPTSIRAGDRYMIQEELSELNFPEKNNKEDFQNVDLHIELTISKEGKRELIIS